MKASHITRPALTTVALVALGTATLTVMTFWAGPMEAGGEPDANGASYARPKLVAAGVEMTLAVKDSTVLRAGDQPVFELTASNTDCRPAELTVGVTISALAPVDRLSRTPSMPAKLWQCDQSVALKANETKIFTLSAGIALPTNRVILVTLQEGKTLDKTLPEGSLDNATRTTGNLSPKPGVVALSFSTAASPRQAKG